MQLDTKTINNRILAAKALASPTVQASILSSVENTLKKFNAGPVTNWRGDEAPLDIGLAGSSQPGLAVSIYHKDNDMYDTMMQHKNTYIGSTETISCNIIIENVMVDYDVTAIISLSLSCDLPEEDLNTLRMLGKVKTITDNTSYSKTYETINCEV